MKIEVLQVQTNIWSFQPYELWCKHINWSTFHIGLIKYHLNYTLLYSIGDIMRRY